MAEATKKTRTVSKDFVTLTLSIEEAETLMAVGAKIGGDREDSPRAHYEAIVRALSRAGVRDFTASGAHPYKHLNRNAPGLMFTSKPQTNANGLFYGF
ncbi:hypothetical protein [Streptomyces sp. DG1A-41]|uniref:hypothetical protein n=1 Tax=Streptomyces sp. DG1A-41 TaxID=3125779 RepID=UPI0030D0296B